MSSSVTSSIISSAGFVRLADQRTVDVSLDPVGLKHRRRRGLRPCNFVGLQISSGTESPRWDLVAAVVAAIAHPAFLQEASRLGGRPWSSRSNYRISAAKIGRCRLRCVVVVEVRGNTWRGVREYLVAIPVPSSLISSSNSGSLIPFFSSSFGSVISSSNSSSLTKKRFFLFERVTRGNCYYARGT